MKNFVDLFLPTEDSYSSILSAINRLVQSVEEKGIKSMLASEVDDRTFNGLNPVAKSL